MTDQTPAGCTDPCIACMTGESHDPAPTPAPNPAAHADTDLRELTPTEIANHVGRAIFALKTPSPTGSEHYCSGWDTGLDAATDAARDAVLAALPAPTDQTAEGIDWKAKYEAEHARHVAVVGQLVADPAAVLRGAADDWTAHCPNHTDAEETFMDCPCDWADELRRKADEIEAQQAGEAR